METISYPTEIWDDGNASPNSGWSNLEYAISNDGRYAKCKVTGRTGNRPKPSPLTAHGFKWDYGDHTKVKGIRIEWRDYKSKESQDNLKGIDGVTVSIPEWDLVETVNEGVSKYGVTHEVLFTPDDFYFGGFHNISIKLEYNSNSQTDSFDVFLEFIRVTLIHDEVAYFISNNYTVIDGVWYSPEVECNAGDIVEETVYFRNASGIEDDPQEIVFDLPEGIEFYGYELESGTFNEDTMTWTVDPPAMLPVMWDEYKELYGNEPNVMQIKMRYCVTRIGEFNVKATHKTAGETNFYIHSRKFVPNPTKSSIGMDYDDMFEVGVPTTARLIISDFKSKNKNLQYWFHQTGDSLDDCDFKYNFVAMESTKNVESVSFQNLGSNGLFTINLDDDYDWDGFTVVIDLTFTYITTDDSINQFSVRPYYTTEDEVFYYLICDKRGHELIFAPDVYEFYGRGMACPTEDGGYVLPAIGATTGTYFELILKSLYGYIEYPQRHIGNVILPHAHYDPKLTYKNTLVESSYKNRKYMGKKGDWAEDLDLNLTLPKFIWTSLKGIVQMDKPVYINTVPFADDDDLLNHRGWAVVSEISSLEQRNPFEYEGSLTVDYLTHEYSPLLSIEIGNRVCDINPPASLLQIIEDRDPLDGLFVFDNEYYQYDNGVNKFTADLGRSIIMTNRWVLTDTAEYIFDWTSVLPTGDENPYYYNTVEFRVLNGATGDILLTYTYYNFEHKNGEGEVINECNVSGILFEESKSYSVVNEHIHLDYDADEPTRYGSKLHFKFNNGFLSLIDEGINGSQVVLNDLELQSGEYKIQLLFNNRDLGLLNPEFVNVVNVTAYEDSISGKYTNFYKDLIVSPMPLPMNLVFYRITATGTLYYYTGEMRNATYFSDPFNQYKGGVNLETKNGVNVISTDTNANPLFLQNGLVRAGFDRNFGSVQIHVYDKESAKWVYVNSLKVKNFNDFSIISYSDDMISIGFGETTWTLWRGRPFLQVEHPNDDLIVLDDYDTVTCERLVDTDGYVHHDGDLEEIYLHRLRTSTILSSAQDEYYVDEPVELIACVFDAYGDKISVDENNETMGEVDYYIDGEFYDTVLEPYRPYTWTDLQEQILELNDGDTLILDNNYEYNSEIDSSLIDGISIDKDLTIVCEGYDFMCDNQALIFTILPNCTLTVQDGCFSEGRINEELSSTTIFPSEEEDSETKTDKYYYATVHGKLQLINMKIQTAEDEFILDYNGSIEGQGNITDTTNMKSGE